MEDARLYDLDTVLSHVRNWYELENIKVYYERKKKNKSSFEG